jgi:hypothetical protein
MRNTNVEEVRRVADSIRDYLERNPEASDTVDGISQWWMAHDRAVSRENLSCALDTLLAEGHLERFMSRDGHYQWKKRSAA